MELLFVDVVLVSCMFITVVTLGLVFVGVAYMISLVIEDTTGH